MVHLTHSQTALVSAGMDCFLQFVVCFGSRWKLILMFIAAAKQGCTFQFLREGAGRKEKWESWLKLVKGTFHTIRVLKGDGSSSHSLSLTGHQSVGGGQLPVHRLWYAFIYICIYMYIYIYIKSWLLFFSFSLSNSFISTQEFFGVSYQFSLPSHWEVSK